MTRYVDTRKPGVAGVDDRAPYRRRWTGKVSLVFIMILSLVAIRLYQNRDSEGFGKQIITGEAEPRTTPTPITEMQPRTTPTPITETEPRTTPTPLTEIKTAPADPPEVVVEEPPGVAAEPPRVAAKPPRVAARPPRVATKPLRVAVRPSRVVAKSLRVVVEPPRVATRPRTVVVEPPRVVVERRPALTTELQSDIMGYARIIAENANLRERPGVQYRLIGVLPRNREVAVLRQLDINARGEAWVEVLAVTDQGWRKGWVMRSFLTSCNCPTY